MRNALGLLVALASAAPAQRVAARELSLGAAATTGGADFLGVAVGVARRTGTQGRLALSVAGGPRGGDGDAAARIEATGQFLLNAGARSGTALYAAGGAAYAGARGYRGAAYLVAWLGLEQGGAWAPRGWYAELGLGGGMRAAFGLRWRRWHRQ